MKPKNLKELALYKRHMTPGQRSKLTDYENLG